MGENNKITLKLTHVINVDRAGNEVKDELGSKSYFRDDSFALHQFCELMNNKMVSLKDRRAAVSLSEKSRDAFLISSNEIELNLEEAALLKKFLESENHSDITYRMGLMRTMEGLLEQLK